MGLPAYSRAPLGWLHTQQDQNCVKDDLMIFCISLFFLQGFLPDWLTLSSIRFYKQKPRASLPLNSQFLSIYTVLTNLSIPLGLHSHHFNPSHHLFSLELFQWPLNWFSLIYAYLSSVTFFMPQSKWKSSSYPLTNLPFLAWHVASHCS